MYPDFVASKCSDGRVDCSWEAAIRQSKERSEACEQQIITQLGRGSWRASSYS